MWEKSQGQPGALGEQNTLCHLLLLMWLKESQNFSCLTLLVIGEERIWMLKPTACPRVVFQTNGLCIFSISVTQIQAVKRESVTICGTRRTLTLSGLSFVFGFYVINSLSPRSAQVYQMQCHHQQGENGWQGCSFLPYKNLH